MTTNEFYQIIKDFAKKEMFEQGEKASKESDPIKHYMRQGACNEAEKFYRLIESLWINN